MGQEQGQQRAEGEKAQGRHSSKASGSGEVAPDPCSSSVRCRVLRYSTGPGSAAQADPKGWMFAVSPKWAGF